MAQARRTTGRGDAGGRGRGKPTIKQAAVAGNKAGGRAFAARARAGGTPSQARRAGMKAASASASAIMGRKVPAGARDTTGRGDATERGG